MSSRHGVPRKYKDLKPGDIVVAVYNSGQFPAPLDYPSLVLKWEGTSGDRLLVMRNGRHEYYRGTADWYEVAIDEDLGEACL